MSNCFSGWWGRRSARAFYDELPRVTIGDCKQHAPGMVTFTTADGNTFSVQLVLIPSGKFLNVPRMKCSRCGRACCVLYLHGEARCYRCTDARYRTTSESPARRAVLAALKVWRKHVTKIDYKRPAGKPKWIRWPTFEKREAAADAAFPVIERDDCAPYEATAKFEAKLNAPRRKRGRPPKIKE
ncbi:MAG: hypothetical protein Q8O52_18745 [Sulfuritalea sp.]|nr:hypothetical protein [Sulfuritalea sp.]